MAINPSAHAADRASVQRTQYNADELAADR
jgi:hypothetical protein